LASLFYRGANYILNEDGVPSDDVLKIWQTAFNSKDALPTDASALAEVGSQITVAFVLLMMYCPRFLPLKQMEFCYD
jgi:hypothetical protein